MSVVTFDRRGELVVHGHDLHGRPDAVDFRARAGEAEIDRLVEVVVTISGWGTREGVATLLESDGYDGWEPLAGAMPFDALYVTRAMPVKLVFSEYIRLQPGARYLLHMPGALVCEPSITITAIQRPDEPGALLRRPRRRARKAA